MTDWGRARIGRYQAGRAACGCSNEAVPGTSKIETDLFSLLNFVLGNGQQGYLVDGSKALRADMAFQCGPGLVLFVEYDGAYWHEGREATDWRKVTRLMGRWDDVDHHVIRVREAPLVKIGPNDITVPKGADAATCARLVLTHALHDLLYAHDLQPRIEHFLLAAAEPLERKQVECWMCWDVVECFRWAGKRLRWPRVIWRSSTHATRDTRHAWRVEAERRPAESVAWIGSP
jgi:hypothetical protein